MIRLHIAMKRVGHFRYIFKHCSHPYRGVWAVPYITGLYLIRGAVLNDPEKRPQYIRGLLDPDMAMCANYRAKVRP